MENLKVKWHKHSQSQFDRIATWYSCNMGAKAAMNFSEDVRRTVMLLFHSLRIGIWEKRRSTVKTKYYSILVHPKYRIVYRFQNDSLYCGNLCYDDEVLIAALYLLKITYT